MHLHPFSVSALLMPVAWGAGRTFHPISDTARIYAKLEEVAAELARDMSEDGWTGKTVTLKYKLDTYQGVLYTIAS